jgi:phosphopantothenoylcysteine decarboxylase/phosphopantothenate--cysteine ligase
MNDLLAGRRIGLGVSGSIAAYKALSLASLLTQAGALVDVLLTRAAGELVRPLAFQALTHRPVVTDLWDPRGELALDHVTIAHGLACLVVAPATADVLARLALGLADDALTTTALASVAPLVLAPAMEPRMWAHPATRAHVATLVGRGAHLVGPEAGRMASGEQGVGRMAEPDVIAETIRWVLAAGGPLTGRRILVTAGPTREAIDPARYLSNLSTGLMGLALARGARDLGADVTLVHGPIDHTPPAGIRTRATDTAEAMRHAVLTMAPDMDAVIMAAAVADFRPAESATSKIKKSSAGLVLELVPNPDILADLDAALSQRAARPMRVGFAAETDDLLANANDKLVRKGLDLIVANAVPASFGDSVVEAILVDGAAVMPIGPCAKEDLAAAILARVGDWLAQHRPIPMDTP